MEGEKKSWLEHAMRITENDHPNGSSSPCSRRFNERWSPIGILILLLACSPGPTFGQSDNATSQSSETSDPRPRQYLFGDWGGERTSLASEGVTFDFFYVADLQANPIGGLEQTQVGWGRIRGTMDVDFG
jgi:carbohydrate-selective porin OprB